MGLLLLGLLRRNRSSQVLWLAAPLLVSLALGWLGAIAFFTGEREILQANFNAVAYGVAALWLVTPYFDKDARLLSFLGALLTVELAGLVAALLWHSWIDDTERRFTMVRVAVFGAVLPLALYLAGWSCRWQFNWRRLSVWLLLWFLGCWSVPFLVGTLLGDPRSLWTVTEGLLTFTAISLGLMLPFLLLSFVHGWFGERLKKALCLK